MLCATCSNNVLFPAPGLAVIIVMESLTIPPPITLSNSLIPVIILSLLLEVISDNFFTGFIVSDTFLATAATLFFFSTRLSSKVFQLLQSGHFPSHFGDS